MTANNESVLQSFHQFLSAYRTGVPPGLPVADVSTVDVPDLSSDNLQTVVLRSRNTTDSCLFSSHKISPNDVEPEVFDWVYYHLDHKKCPYPLAFALASIVARKLGLAAVASDSESLGCEADNSKPAISSNELYSQSLEYLTEYINSWKENPEIAVEIAKEYSWQRFHTSLAAIKNSRRKMEDRHVVLHDLNKALGLKSAKQYSYYAIFDGHAGVDAASYASAHLHHNLVKSQAFLDGDITAAFKEAFSVTDLHYLERSAREGKKSGSTALCTIIENGSKFYLAWLGDSQAVLVSNGKPVDIMVAHKPELEQERKRIEELGGFVAYVDTWRVNGTLAVSRAIGDPEHKPYISSEPDVVEFDIDSNTDFLIMACDGLWDQLTPEEATSLAYDYICKHSEQDMEELTRNISSYLSKVAKDDGSSDNITTIVIFFKDLEQLRATPFKPLTPREKNETNGFSGNHFQFNELEFLQSNAKNPFDLSSEQSLQWTSESFDQMNNAKLDFEISDSINSGEDMSHNSNPNPFVTSEYSIADMNNENKLFDRSVDSNFNHNESSLSKQSLNSYDINDLKAESDASQTLEKHCNDDPQSVQTDQTDSQFNISKLSDISSSFPTQGVSQSDHALCSTPLQSLDLQTGEELSIHSIPNQSITCEQLMEDKSSLDVVSSVQSNEDIKPSIPADISMVGSVADSFKSAQSTADNDPDATDTSTNFEKSGYQTAFELSSQLDESTETPIKLLDVCDKVFANIDEVNADYSPDIHDMHDNNDLSSGAESVDSFCYEKISSDMNEIRKRVENDFPLEQTYGTSLADTNGDQEQQTPLMEDKSAFGEASEAVEAMQSIGAELPSEQTGIDVMPTLSSCAQTNEEIQQVMDESVAMAEPLQPIEAIEQPIGVTSIEEPALVTEEVIVDKDQGIDISGDSLIKKAEPEPEPEPCPYPYQTDVNESFADQNNSFAIPDDMSAVGHTDSPIIKESSELLITDTNADTISNDNQLIDVCNNFDNNLTVVESDAKVDLASAQPIESNTLPGLDDLSANSVEQTPDIKPEIDIKAANEMSFNAFNAFEESEPIISAVTVESQQMSNEMLLDANTIEPIVESKPNEDTSLVTTCPPSTPLIDEVKPEENKLLLDQLLIDNSIVEQESVIETKSQEVDTTSFGVDTDMDSGMPSMFPIAEPLVDSTIVSANEAEVVVNGQHVHQEPDTLVDNENTTAKEAPIDLNGQLSPEPPIIDNKESLHSAVDETVVQTIEKVEPTVISKVESPAAPTSKAPSVTKSMKPLTKTAPKSAPLKTSTTKPATKTIPITKKSVSAPKSTLPSTATRATATKTASATVRPTSSVPPAKSTTRQPLSIRPASSTSSTAKSTTSPLRTTAAKPLDTKPRIGTTRTQTTSSTTTRMATSTVTRTAPTRSTTSTLSTTGAARKPVSSSVGTAKPAPKPIGSSIGSNATNKTTSTTSGITKRAAPTLATRRPATGTTLSPTKSAPKTNGITKANPVTATKSPVKPSVAAVSRINTGRPAGAATAKAATTATAKTTTTNGTASSVASIGPNAKPKAPSMSTSLKQELEDALSQPQTGAD